MLKRILFFILLSALSLYADDPDAESLLRRISSAMHTVRTARCDFEMTKQLQVVNQTVQINGMLCLDRSGRLACHVFSPIRYSFLLNGSLLTLWDEDSNTENSLDVSKDAAFRRFASSMKNCFSGNPNYFKSDYTFALSEAGTLLLSPKKGTLPAKMMESIRITPSADESAIREIVFHELSGDTTTIRFSNIKTNVRIPESLWRIQSK